MEFLTWVTFRQSMSGDLACRGVQGGPSVRTLCRNFGTLCRVNSAPYQLPALPCGDRAADR
jgi:hypothetical protein